MSDEEKMDNECERVDGNCFNCKYASKCEYCDPRVDIEEW